MDGNIIEFSNSTYDKSFAKISNVREHTEKNMLFLYVRFNTALDPRTIDKKTTCVIDENNKTVSVSISYNKRNNTIIVKPAKPYVENKPYHLYITKSIKSLHGRPLSENIKINFQIADNKVTKYKILNGRKAIKAATEGKKNTTQTVVKTFLSNTTIVKKLPFARQYSDTLFILISIVITVISFKQELNSVVVFGLIFFIVISVKSGLRLFTPKSKAKELYNLGVKKFNLTNYEESISFLEYALEIDPDNAHFQKAVDIAYEKLIESYFKN